MRIADRAIVFATVLLFVAAGCDQLDGRNRNRKGNTAYRETRFVDAATEFEKALAEVKDPIVEYNLGLAYSKIFKPGVEGGVLIDTMGSNACKTLPNIKTVTKQVCVKAGDKHFQDCDEKNVCASSFQCQKTDLCAIDNAVLADTSATHFEVWVKVQPADELLKKQIAVVEDQITAMQKDPNSTEGEIKALQGKEDDLKLKDKIRGLMTQMWLDSSQYPKAVAYWQVLLDAKPNNPDLMGNLAGINLKAGEWRKSIEWYLKVAAASTETSSKVAAYQFIGNVAWAKLNSKSLTRDESLELADRGIGALQKASELQPENGKLYGLMGSIFNFRGQAQGASWAGAIDRATMQDLQHTSRVLNEKARKAAGPAAPTNGAATNPTPNPAKTGG